MTDLTNAQCWQELAAAVREATLLGAEFRIVGAEIEIAGDLPDELRAALPADMLYSFFGARQVDNEALDFGDKLGVDVVLVEDDATALAAIEELSAAAFIGIDIETAVPGARPAPVRINQDGSVAARQDEHPDRSGLDPHQAEIASLQMYGGGDQCFIFRGEFLQLMINSDWLRERHLVAHNATFEIAFLQHHARPAEGVEFRYPVECSMQAQGLLNGPYRRSLAAACSDFLGAAPPKLLQTSCWAAPQLSPGQICYAASDAILTWFLWGDMAPALQAKGRDAAYRLQRDAIPAVADMQLRGLGLDREEHARQVDIWARELAAARHEFVELTGNPPPSKPNEVRAWLREVLGDRVASWPHTQTGLLSIEAGNLKRLVLADIPAVRPVLAILAKEKLLSTFGTKLREHVSPVTGRLHASYRIGGTKTGRFAATDPNLQQLPSARAPDFKGCIVAAPGNVLVGGDWSQIDLRAAAWVSGDLALTAVYEEGRDLHRETAALIAGVPIDDVTPEQRQAAKPINFGSIYGIGAEMLAANAFADYGVEMSVAEAQAALDQFFRTFRVLRQWMWAHADLCQRRGFIEIGCGRVVEAAWEPGGRLTYPQCCNLPIQGAAADAMLRALPLVHHRLRGLRGGLVASVHDELLVEVAEDDAAAATRILEESMTEAFALTFPGAPTRNVVEVKTGRTWKDTK